MAAVFDVYIPANGRAYRVEEPGVHNHEAALEHFIDKSVQAKEGLLVHVIGPTGGLSKGLMPVKEFRIVSEPRLVPQPVEGE